MPKINISVLPLLPCFGLAERIYIFDDLYPTITRQIQGCDRLFLWLLLSVPTHPFYSSLVLSKQRATSLPSIINYPLAIHQDTLQQPPRFSPVIVKLTATNSFLHHPRGYPTVCLWMSDRFSQTGNLFFLK